MVLALKDTADFPIPTKNIIDNDNNFNYTTAGSINAYDRTYLDIINANRTKFFPPDKVLIERSTDGGSTWTTVDTSTYTTAQRGNLMSDIGATLNIGTGNPTTSQQLRVTLQYPGGGWYCSLDRAYIRFSMSGHTTTVTIQASTYGAQSTYTDIAANQSISGWPGDNMVKFASKTAWGTNASYHLYNIRFIFKYTAINSSYASNQANVSKISMFGKDFWGTTGTPRYAGHLYNWDYLQNVTFPANVTASAFLGNATSSTYLLGNGRIASADIAHISAGNKVHQRLDIVSSTLTTGRPAGDGYLTTYMWDNAGTYDAQFYMPNDVTTNGGRPQVRYRPNGGSWSEWKSLALTTDTPPLPNNIAYIGSEVAGGGALIQTSDIANGAITTDKIADGAVTPAKLGDTGWIDASSQAGLNRCFYRKVGNIVYITLESAGNKSVGASYTTVFTLPVGFRPSISWNFVWQNISSADSRANGWINTDGTVQLYSSVSKNYWYGSTSFPVD